MIIKYDEVNEYVKARTTMLAAVLVEQVKLMDPVHNREKQLENIMNNTTTLMEYYDQHAARLAESGHYSKPIWEYETTDDEYRWNKDIFLSDPPKMADDAEFSDKAEESYMLHTPKPLDLASMTPSEQFIYKQFAGYKMSCAQAVKAYVWCSCTLSNKSQVRRYLLSNALLIEKYPKVDRKTYALDRKKVATYLLTLSPQTGLDILTYFANSSK